MAHWKRTLKTLKILKLMFLLRSIRYCIDLDTVKELKASNLLTVKFKLLIDFIFVLRFIASTYHNVLTISLYFK